jgi:putative hemolysin
MNLQTNPLNARALKRYLYNSTLLVEIGNGKKVFLYDYEANSPVIHEIGRLRELAFKTVGEGTGKHLDIDEYDAYYRHIILWDDNESQLIGAYRLGEGWNIMKNYGKEGFYAHDFFKFKPEFLIYLPNCVEMGRSFIQPRYQSMYNLYYLWQGIAAYIRQNLRAKYLFGQVSLSNNYPDAAKETIIGFYHQQFGSNQDLAQARRPFVLSKAMLEVYKKKFNQDYISSFKLLKNELNKHNVNVPILYRHYSELCNDKGCRFVDFNIDSAFNCIDSLVFIEIEKLKPQIRKMYFS